MSQVLSIDILKIFRKHSVAEYKAIAKVSPRLYIEIEKCDLKTSLSLLYFRNYWNVPIISKVGLGLLNWADITTQSNDM